MCIGDWRLGRLIKSKATAFDVSGGIGLVYPNDRNRVGILFDCNGGTGTIASFVNATFLNGSIITFASGYSPVLVTLATHGELSTIGFTLSQVGTLRVGVITEFFLPESQITAALEEFNRQYGIHT